MRIFSILILFVFFSFLMLSTYVLWNFKVMVSEQFELMELESMLGSIDPVRVQNMEWIKDNGLLVTGFVAVGSMIGFFGSIYLRQLRRKGMYFLFIGAFLIIAAMIMFFHVHPAFAIVLIIVQVLLIFYITVNRSKLN